MTKFILTLFFVSTFFIAVNAQISNEKLRGELLKMRDVDQKAREDCGKGNADAQMKCYVEIAEKIDKPNTKRLEEIYAQNGFPTAKTVGKDGVDAFMLILQHAPDETLRLKLLKPIEKAFKRKEISANEYTNYVDRLLVRQGKLQIYGSNFEMKDGKLVMSEVKDLKNLDKIRLKVGLPTIKEYAEMLQKAYNLEVEIPAMPK